MTEMRTIGTSVTYLRCQLHHETLSQSLAPSFSLTCALLRRRLRSARLDDTQFVESPDGDPELLLKAAWSREAAREE